MEHIVIYVTGFASLGLFGATWVLVGVTAHHVRSATKMAAAAERLAEVIETSTLVSAIAALPAANTTAFPDTIRSVIHELKTRRESAQQRADQEMQGPGRG
ncbi:MAG TPA: hypothetical protein VHR45_23185 [Thermoanaerobaculia bacterium]|nr:hypothetical protein [Thermoanaerobaculia bacterium]